MTIRSETRGRARALQLLYAWELRDHPDIEMVADGFLTLGCARQRQSGLRLAIRVIDQLERLDTDISDAIEGWRLERIGTVELNILRLALSELLSGDAPPRVVIDEAVKLAQWFAGPKGPSFVNGVLDALARREGLL